MYLKVTFSVTEYNGLLTPDCTRAYHRMYVTRRVPPRNYYYFHEQLNPDQALAHSEYSGNMTNVDVSTQFLSKDINTILIVGSFFHL